MIRSPRRTAGKALAGLVAAAAVAGCQTGQQAQTAEQLPTHDGNFAQAGSLALRDITIEYPEQGRWAEGDDPRLQMVLVNEGRPGDTLVDVRTDAADGVTFRPAGGAGEEGDTPGEGTASATPEPTGSGSPSGSATPTPEPSGSGTGAASASPTASPSGPVPTSLPIPPAGLVSFRDAGAAIVLENLTRPLRPAEVVLITFVFEQAGEVTVEVPVSAPTGEVEPAPTVPAEGEAGAEVEE